VAISGASDGRELGVSHDPTWRIFRIMSEFVDGFQFLSDAVHHSVTIFGSARLSRDDPRYEQARRLGALLAQAGYTVVTGGGPGIMQASNQGAWEAGGRSVGLNIELPHEQRTNPYVRQSKSFHYFFSRKVMLDFSADAFVFFAGGFGTLDEFFELVTLRQTGKLHNAVPIVLIGSDYWGPLCEWMRQALVETFHTIAPDDLAIWTLTDDLDEAMRVIDAGVRQVRQHRKDATGSERHTANEKLAQATQPMSEREQ
jgi:uncharacterized protein (TIGR00730 family)